jgi:hypothetical protein
VVLGERKEAEKGWHEGEFLPKKRRNEVVETRNERQQNRKYLEEFLVRAPMPVKRCFGDCKYKWEVYQGSASRNFGLLHTPAPFNQLSMPTVLQQFLLFVSGNGIVVNRTGRNIYLIGLEISKGTQASGSFWDCTGPRNSGLPSEGQPEYHTWISAASRQTFGIDMVEYLKSFGGRVDWQGTMESTRR